MEVCKSLQFYSFKYFSSCVLDIYKLIADSFRPCTALLLFAVLFGTDTVFVEKTGCLGRALFWGGPAVPSLGLEEPMLLRFLL